MKGWIVVWHSQRGWNTSRGPVYPSREIAEVEIPVEGPKNDALDGHCAEGQQ